MNYSLKKKVQTLQLKETVQGKQIEIYKYQIDKMNMGPMDEEIESDLIIESIDTPFKMITQRKSQTPRN